MERNSMLWDRCWHGWLLSGTRCGLKDINKPASGFARGSQVQVETGPTYDLSKTTNQWPRSAFPGGVNDLTSYYYNRYFRFVGPFAKIWRELRVEGRLGESLKCSGRPPAGKKSSSWRICSCLRWTLKLNEVVWLLATPFFLFWFNFPALNEKYIKKNKNCRILKKWATAVSDEQTMQMQLQTFFSYLRSYLLTKVLRNLYTVVK